jgi:LL-diaminopimelate aminotransferase
LNPATPQASLYVWCPVPAGKTSAAFTDELLKNAHVSFTPGSVFGQNGEGYMRIAVSSPTEEIEAAVQRMLSYMMR